MTIKNQSNREKKRSLLRQQLHRMTDRNFRRQSADLIRAIRYLRLRNQEIAMVNLLLRLQICLRERSRSKQERKVTLIQLKPREWTIYSVSQEKEPPTTGDTNSAQCLRGRHIIGNRYERLFTSNVSTPLYYRNMLRIDRFKWFEYNGKVKSLYQDFKRISFHKSFVYILEPGLGKSTRLSRDHGTLIRP
jgi:hypothetical protein